MVGSCEQRGAPAFGDMSRTLGPGAEADCEAAHPSSFFPASPWPQSMIAIQPLSVALKSYKHDTQFLWRRQSKIFEQRGRAVPFGDPILRPGQSSKQFYFQ
jgi:hypothetical protein